MQELRVTGKKALLMRIAIIGQKDFGKAVLEAFLARGTQVAAVFCQPEKPGVRPDPIRVFAEEKGVPVHQFASLKGPESVAAIKAMNVDLGVMAYVTQFVSQDFVKTPRLGTIQYHPSLLPKYRGPSAINWAMAHGEKTTGLSIFRPSDGLDEGEIILQKEVPIAPDDTLGSLYFNQLFPVGVKAMLEAADLVFAGKHTETVQDESQASYEGWFKEAESRINFANHIDVVYDLIRACNPAPGAWVSHGGKSLQFFDCVKHSAQRYGQYSGKIGSIAQMTDTALWINVQGGQIEVLKMKHQEGKKDHAGAIAAALGLKVGDILGA
jgi:methionyl-tRNA formyltransferase